MPFQVAQTIRLKRRLVEDPVDSLYLETTSDISQSKRHRAETFVFRRLTESDHAPEPFATAQESKLIEALPGESYRSPQDNQDELLASETDQGLINDTDRMDIVHAPRRFHLMKTRRVDATKSSFGNLKHKAGVALFAEHRDDKLNDIDIDRGAQNLNRRRNKASTSSAARSMTLTSDVVLQRKNSDTTVPIEQEEDIAAIHQYVKDFESLNELESEICMDPNPDIVSSHNTINNDDDADYVYDTYIRHEAIKGSSTMDTMKSPVGAFGYLIISAEDEDFWNAFGEDESESEQDWDSEQDDENAENYYGADYPEDEMASDDEYGSGAYKYRKGGASDEEEFDNDFDD